MRPVAIKDKPSSAIFATLSVLLACTAPVWATEPVLDKYRKIGTAHVIDGDTLDVAGTRIRLHGIDAPESEQTCQDAQGNPYTCGTVATQTLRRLIGSRPVSCIGGNRNGQNFGMCAVGGTDLGMLMVGFGQALANDLSYLEVELYAQSLGIGMWQGAFTAPWDWRRGQR